MVTAEKHRAPYYNLKSLIDRKGMTQNELSEKIGMNRAQFNVKINRAKGRDFSLAEAIEIARVLEVQVDNFF